MDEPFFVHTHIHECSEGSYVCDDAGEFHPFLQVFDVVHTLVEGEFLLLSAGIPAGLCQLLQDVLNRGQACFGGYVSIGLDAFAKLFVSNEFLRFDAKVPGHLSTIW